MPDKIPHKFADTIKAWADGYPIQFFSKQTEEWKDTETPHWYPNVEYRVKPEPKVLYGNLKFVTCTQMPINFVPVQNCFNEYRGTADNVKITFSDSDEIISIEFIPPTSVV